MGDRGRSVVTGTDYWFVVAVDLEMNLSDPVTTVPLVGRSYANRLKKLDIETVEDLLHHYPFRYEDFSLCKKINELIAGEMVTVTATVLEIKAIYTRGGKRLTRATVADETGELQAVWFNPYVTKNIKKGDLVNLSGSLGKSNNKPSFVGPEYDYIKDIGNGSQKPLNTGRLVPIYPETRGISSKWLRSRLNAVFANVDINKIEHLPFSVRQSQNLIGLREALQTIHFPESQDEIDQARKRLGFDEFFLMQIEALKRRAEWQQKPLAKKFLRFEESPLADISSYQLLITRFVDSLPFKLTTAQQRAIDEILKDLEKDVPMNRLLEGDVGSGKTVVATVAMYAAHLNGFQSALMAPTEVLAEQHYKEVSKMLEPFGVKIALRTGSRKTDAGNLKLETRKEARSSKLDNSSQHASLGFDSRQKQHPASSPASSVQPQASVMIGTHALLFDSVEFENLGLVIVDEQHRFGVKQRAKLLRKVESDTVPHLLTMTATPIPRSLALTAYGDLDLSVLDEMPPGRKEVTTWVVPNRKREAAYEWVRKQIQNSAQAFVICPLIEESEAETMQSVKAATAEFERLSEEVFPDLRLALLHGKIKSKEKNETLTDFKNGKYDILVSTQVVEVGIDVPAATIVIIEGAERFGLASLHQLRGRVGRSDRQSYCLLFTSSRSRKAHSRLKAMEETNDGFKLAEIDLKIRGPGELYGIKQHGIKEFKIASLSDVKLIEITRNEAKKILESDPELKANPNLKAKLDRVGEGLVEPN